MPIPSCCYGDEYDVLFPAREAEGTVTRFRRRGLAGSELVLASAVKDLGPAGMSVLEVGGGAGQIHVYLLETGVASTAINIELSKSWEEAAGELIAEQGLEARVQRVIGDFVDQADDLPICDAVILHRVVCCYPDWRAMLTASASKAGRLVGLTFPVDRGWIRIGIRMVNLICRIRGQSFRAFVHPPEQMIEYLRSQGLATVFDRSGWVWRTIAAART